MRQSEKRRLANRSTLSQMRSAIKKYRRLLGEDKAQEAAETLPSIYSLIDRTRRKGVIHANAAARYKSRLARALEGLNKA